MIHYLIYLLTFCRYSQKLKMKNIFLFILIITSFWGCNKSKKVDAAHSINWSKKRIDISEKDSLTFGKSYLSIYSQIYSMSEHKTHNLTTIVSLRNTSDIDTIYLLKATYFDTHGKLIRTYFDYPIFLTPMETTEIIIDELDISGGTGSNFIFDWKIPTKCSKPLFEAVMSSTKGQQGLSFTTQSIQIK